MDIKHFLTSQDINAKKFNAGEFIYRTDEPGGDSVALILNGIVEIFIGEDNGFTVNAKVHQGNFFGFTGLLAEKRSENARAMVNDTKILFISRTSFLNYLKADSHFLATMVQLGIESLQNIPESLIVPPDDSIDIEKVLGKDSAAGFNTIRNKNLRIIEYLNNMRNKLISPGEDLFTSSDLDNSYIYLLVEGTIEQYMVINDRQVPVITVQPGSLFGFLRHLGKKGHLLSAKAGPTITRLIMLDEEMLVRISKLDTELAFSVFMNLVLTIAIVQGTMVKSVPESHDVQDSPS